MKCENCQLEADDRVPLTKYYLRDGEVTKSDPKTVWESGVLLARYIFCSGKCMVEWLYKHSKITL
jgi:hypothetical protein